MTLEHNEILIRDAAIEDSAQLCSWWNDGAVMAHAGFPNGLGTTAAEVEEQIKNSRGRHIILFNNIAMGEMNYRDMGNNVCEIGIKICSPDYQNKGLGKMILSLFIGGLFELGYEKIILDTNADNHRAQHVYEQLGFRKVRTNVNSWKDQLGNFQSSIDYELTKQHFISYLN